MARRAQEPNYGFPPARGGRGAPSMFPRKLFQILCETDPAVVGWDGDGKSFHIANFEEFIEGVMPLFYRHNKLTSFQRQLNLYGFKKMGRDEKFPGHYYHPSFQRDHPDILGGVRRSYPVTSPKWEDDGSIASPENEAAAAVAAAEGSHRSSTSPRRKRAALSPTRKLDGTEQQPAVRRETNPLQQQQQQQQHQHQHQRVRHTPVNDDEHGLLPPAPLAYDDGCSGGSGGAEHDVRGGGEGLEEGRGGEQNSIARKKPAHRPWFYSGSPALSSAAATARLDGQKRGAKADNMVEDDVDVYTRTGRASDREGGIKAVAGEGDSSRRDLSYAPAGGSGRRWTSYGYQEDPYLAAGGGGGGGAGWYDSEESSLSRLNSCDSVYSAWDDAQQPGGGGGPYYGRGRTRAAAASGMAVGPEGEPRRSPYPPETGGVIGRSSGARPVHRAVPTSAMFPAHFLRHERFGGYQGPHYPPPPAYLPAHTYSDPDAAPVKPSRWRPVYNGGGGGGGGGRSGEDGWAGSERRLSDGKSAVEWGPESYGADEERALAAGGRGVKSRGAVAAKANSPAVTSRDESVAGGDGQGYNNPSASSYRAACDDFLNEEGGEGAAPERAARFRFAEPKSGSGVAPAPSAHGAAREAAVGVRASSRAMAATV